MGTAELEQRAERAVRRGELLVALEHFDAYLAQEPEDERVRQRMEAVRALLQPSELVSRRRAEPEEPEHTAGALSDAELGEMHASSGRFTEAAACYQRACSANPKNELLKERYEELRALASPHGRADLGSAEKLDGPLVPPGKGLPKVPRSASASAASFSPLQPATEKRAAERPLPGDKVRLLEDLLGRIRSSRRSPKPEA